MHVSALPGLLARTPPRVQVLGGIAVMILGLLIVFRPLTSLLLLSIYVGVSLMASGLIDLFTRRGTPRWWTRSFDILWIAGGVAVLIWVGRSLDFLPVVLALLLLVGGLASLGDAVVDGSVSERVLSAAWGAAQIAFGILSLTWPDVTVLVVAVVFGVRTVVFGISLTIRGVLALRAAGATVPSVIAPPSGAARRLAASGRYALVLLLVVIMSTGWWLNGWLAGGAPVIDAFYDPPATVPAAHGELLRSDDSSGRLPPDAAVRRILYTTTDAMGAPAIASALVISPVKPFGGPRPVVLWNHGTTGVARGCAPSLREDGATKWAIPAVDEALAKGWVVVAPDYSGQGAAGVFPYLIGEGEGRSALDAVLAARRMPELSLLRDVVVWGHSQGGHAALWASEIAAEYTPDLRILGTAALSPIADPYALARALTVKNPSPLLTVLISWVLVPYSETYPDVHITDYVSPGARSIVREMAQRCPSEPGVIVSVLTALGVSEDRPLYVGDLTTRALGRRLKQNAASGPWAQPLLIAWGDHDEAIPPEMQQTLVDRLCDQGNRVRWMIYQGYDHIGIILPGSRFLPVLVDWTDDRFARRSGVVDDCGR